MDTTVSKPKKSATLRPIDFDEFFAFNDISKAENAFFTTEIVNGPPAKQFAREKWVEKTEPIIFPTRFHDKEAVYRFGVPVLPDSHKIFVFPKRQRKMVFRMKDANGNKHLVRVRVWLMSKHEPELSPNEITFMTVSFYAVRPEIFRIIYDAESRKGKIFRSNHYSKYEDDCWARGCEPYQ